MVQNHYNYYVFCIFWHADTVFFFLAKLLRRSKSEDHRPPCQPAFQAALASQLFQTSMYKAVFGGMPHDHNPILWTIGLEARKLFPQGILSKGVYVRNPDYRQFLKGSLLKEFT